MPTINENLQRLQTCKSDISSAITTKGGTVSSGDGFEEFPADIATIPTTISIYAFLYLTVDAGATATISKDGTTLTQISSAGEELLFEIPSSGTWSISVSKTGETTRTDSVVINEQKDYYLSLNFPKVYGVQWDKTSSVMTRTDNSANFVEPDPYVADGSHPGSSPFDTLYPWSEMTTGATINTNFMVKIPKFYFKISNSAIDGTGTFRLQISDKPKEGFSLSPAHRDKGYGEKDYIYVGQYHCSSMYKSSSGITPKTDITRSEARSGCESTFNGGHFHLWDYSTVVTIWMLYLVEFANWDSQSVIGYGCSANESKYTTGQTNIIPYHTGTVASSRTSYSNGIKYRNIEDLWGNVMDLCDGVVFRGNKIYAFSNISQYSDSYSGATLIGTRPTSTDYIQDFNISSDSNFDWLLYPSLVGSNSTKVCDTCYYTSSYSVFKVGASYYSSRSYGLFTFSNDLADAGSVSAGARLIYIPA